MAPKRAQSPSRDAGSKSTTTPSRLERSGEEVDERGEFEDAWEDEFEKEDIQSGDEDDDHDDGAGHLEGVNGDKDTGMEEDLDGERCLALDSGTCVCPAGAVAQKFSSANSSPLYARSDGHSQGWQPGRC